MAVTSRAVPPADEQQARSRGIALPLRAGLLMLALLAVAIAVPGWVRGARYTVEGWAIVVQVVLDILTLPVRVRVPAGSTLAILVLAAGAAYSVAEVFARPRQSWLRLGVGTLALLVLLWLVLIGTDIGTTVIGVLNTPPTAWTAEQWIAARPPAAALYGFFLTFYPETLTVFAAFLARMAVR